LIAKEFSDAGATPSKTSLNWNIRGEPREPLSPSPASPVTRDSFSIYNVHHLNTASPLFYSSKESYPAL